MEDSTSPTTNTGPQITWPAVAVPGQGTFPARAPQTETPSPEVRTGRSSAADQRGDRHTEDAGTEHGPRGDFGPRYPDGGDRPRPWSPQSGDRKAPDSGNSPVGSPGTGDRDDGPQGTASGTGLRSAEAAVPGPRPSPGTAAGPGTEEPESGTERAGTVLPVDGSGTGNREGTDPCASGDGAAVLDELRGAIGRYVVLPSEEALTAVTLWVAATHIQSVLQHAPRLAVVGPTKGCGKSRLLDVLHETVHRPMMTVNTSPAVVFRVIGKNPPTLLVDEADTIFGPKAGDKEDLRGLLNAGHQRNRPAWRISGPEQKPTSFPTFAMAALAGIGDLPDTIMDRAVVLRMQKRKPGERITPFRSRHSVPELNTVRDRLAAWLTPLRGTAAGLVPQMPVEDRAADTWEPLVTVADLAGSHWPDQARAACLAMTRSEVLQDEQTTLKTRLLRDIRRVFDTEGTEVLRTQDVLAALIQDAEGPWAEYGTSGLNAYHLGNLLRDFGISSANHRFDNGRQAKAYTRNRFLDAWARYCPEPIEPAPGRQPRRTASATPTGSLPIGPPGGPARPTRAR